MVSREGMGPPPALFGFRPYLFERNHFVFKWCFVVLGASAYAAGAFSSLTKCKCNEISNYLYLWFHSIGLREIIFVCMQCVRLSHGAYAQRIIAKLAHTPAKKLGVVVPVQTA